MKLEQLQIGINQTLGESIYTESRDFCLLLLNGGIEELKEVLHRVNIHEELIEVLNYIMANPFDFHLIEDVARKALEKAKQH